MYLKEEEQVGARVLESRFIHQISLEILSKMYGDPSSRVFFHPLVIFKRDFEDIKFVKNQRFYSISRVLSPNGFKRFIMAFYGYTDV